MANLVKSNKPGARPTAALHGQPMNARRTMTKIGTKTLASAVGAGLMGLGFVTSAQADGYSAPGRVAYERPFSWTGLYIGGSVGTVDSSTSWTFHDPSQNPSVQTGAPNLPGCQGGAGPPVVPNTCTQIPPPLPDRPVPTIRDRSMIYDAHVGYNYQHGSLVLGVEAGLSWIDGDGTVDCANTLTPAQIPNGTTFTNFTGKCRARTDFLGTLGPRLGFAVDRLLVYGTGGYAFTQITTRELTAAGVWNGDKSRAGYDGWFIGAGLEYAIHSNIILGVEYKHLEFATQNTLASKVTNGAVFGFAAAQEARNIGAEYDIFTARLSYKFDNAPRVDRPLK